MSLGNAASWLAFEKTLRDINRLAPSQQDYIREVVTAAEMFKITLPAGSKLYRGRLMPPGWRDKQGPYPCEQMGAPPSSLVTDGRLNPAGIPYLYLADSPDTATAELRPWREARVTVATFEITDDVELYDFVTAPEPSSEEARLIHWLGYVFSVPAHRDDRLAYVATQFLSESLKAKGNHGVRYPSALRPQGVNFALFHPLRAKCVGTELRKVTSVEIQSYPTVERWRNVDE